jgi:hypothetical protein
MFKGMKTTLAIVALVIMGCIVSCGPCESEKCEEVCDSTKTDSTCVVTTTTTDSVTISDVSAEADTAQ